METESLGDYWGPAWLRIGNAEGFTKRYFIVFTDHIIYSTLINKKNLVWPEWKQVGSFNILAGKPTSSVEGKSLFTPTSGREWVTF